MGNTCTVLSTKKGSSVDATHDARGDPVPNVYGFQVEQLPERRVDLGTKRTLGSNYRGKVILVTNIAMDDQQEAKGQIRDLNRLYRVYAHEGLDILGFPCWQFGTQPQSYDDVHDGIRDYGILFTIMCPVDVNGPGSHLLFEYLKAKLAENGPYGFDTDIKGNFTKFIISRRGIPLRRYEPHIQPLSMEDDIIDAINEDPYLVPA